MAATGHHLSSVLLVDDDRDLVSLMSLLFEDEGVAVTAADSLSEVKLKRPAALRSELAILDISLGVGQPSGVDVCGYLREQGFKGQIVFLTAYDRSHPDVARTAEFPDVRVMDKTVGVTELLTLAECA